MTGLPAGPPLRLWAYALPAAPFAMPVIPAFVALPAFYAQSVGLGLTATGAALMLTRLLDVPTDPLVGWLSDRWGGRRKPFMAVGALLAAVGLVRLFSPPDGAGVAHLALWSTVLYLGWTLVSVPYTAWGADLSRDYHARSKIAGAREAAGIGGILAAGMGLALLAGSGEAAALSAVAWAAVGLGAVALPLCLALVPEVRPGEGEAGRALERRPERGPGRLLGNRPLRRLVAAWLANGLSAGAASALFPLYMEHVLEAGAQARGVLIGLYFAAGMAAVPLWLALSRRLGKHRTWCGAMALASLAFAFTPLLGAGDVAAFAAVCLVTGAALGADLTLPPAMQADVADYDALRRGGRRTGLLFAVWGMATKLSLALAVGLVFPLLDAVGFDPAAGGGTAALAMIYAAVPLVFKAVAVALMWDFPLDERRQEIIRRRLDRRSHVPQGRRSQSRLDRHGMLDHEAAGLRRFHSGIAP